MRALIFKLLYLAIIMAVFSPARAIDVSTSFEGISQSTIVIGTSPNTATFTGGVSQTVGNSALYHSGVYSWHINANNTGTVNFESNASAVEFWFRDAPGASPSEVRIFDENDQQLLSTAGTQTFTQVNLSRTSGQSLIARVEVENMGGADTVVDDFSFTVDDMPVVFDPADPLPNTIPLGNVTVELVPLATDLVAPNWGTFAPGDSGSLYVSDQVGRIMQIDLSSGASEEFHDLSTRLVNLGSFDERGLLGLAFHPDFATNGLFYTYTSEPVAANADFTTLSAPDTPSHQSVILEWRVTSPNSALADVDPFPRELLRIDQPQGNHNGGALAFDANGNLLIALGDGGGADDEGTGHGADGNGRDPFNVLGSLLRIDPLGNNSANGRYGIPVSNPFVGSAEVDEIYVYGLRNPFRFSFDSANADLWVADVGQNAIEEINRVAAGDNLGWNYKEGSFFFSGNGSSSGTISDIDPGGLPADLVDPVAEYDHDEGNAVIGGFVYRGSEVADLVGRYVFGDYGGNSGNGRLFYLNANNAIRELATDSPFNGFVLGWGQDANGEIYLMANTTGGPSGTTGTVYRVLAAAGSSGGVSSGGSGGGSGYLSVQILAALFLVFLFAIRSARLRTGGRPDRSPR